MLMSESSVADLNARMQDPSGEHGAAMAQFRPNFVVSTSPPFAEDDWDEISIGSEADFTNTKPCERFASAVVSLYKKCSLLIIQKMFSSNNNILLHTVVQLC